MKRLAIPKPDGTKRPLGILTVRDRIVQRAVLQVVEPLFDDGFEECSHDFRKGRSIHTALTQVTRLINLGYGWIVDFDITACFDMINTKLLYTFITQRLKNDELRRLLWAWIEMEAATMERSGRRRKRELRGILQGGILSPLFANIYLDRFDKAALKRGLKLVRYADDGVVCCRSQQEATAALKLVDKLLGKLELATNPRKTAIQHVEKGFDYLGGRFFLKYNDHGKQTVMVRPIKPVPATVTLLPPGRSHDTPTHADDDEEDV